MSSSATKVLPANPFSQWKRTTNLDSNNTKESNLPNEVATVIFSKMVIEQVQVIMENAETLMDRYSLYRNLVSAQTSLTGTELEKFQRLLSMEGQTLIAGGAPEIKPWADLLKDHTMSLGNLKHFDLSDSTDISDGDLIVFTKDCKNLTKLILPGAFPSVEAMTILRENCPQAAIYPTAMTEQEWANPAEFMAKLPPPPQEVTDFINGPRPIWPGKTASEAHMVVPRVNKIVRNIKGCDKIVPWTLKNVDELDKASGGVGFRYIHPLISEPANEKPPRVGFEWVVFTKDVVPLTFHLTYSGREWLVNQYGYEVPDLLDATTCILWENRLSRKRIYGDNPVMYTFCKDIFLSNHLVVGGSTTGGMFANLGNDHYMDGAVGMGGFRAFKI